MAIFSRRQLVILPIQVAHGKYSVTIAMLKLFDQGAGVSLITPCNSPKNKTASPCRLAVNLRLLGKWPLSSRPVTAGAAPVGVQPAVITIGVIATAQATRVVTA